MNEVASVKSKFNASSIPKVARKFLERAVFFGARPILRFLGQPGLSNLGELTKDGFCFSGDNFVSSILGLSDSRCDYSKEFEDVLELFADRHKNITNNYPGYFRVGEATSFALFSLVRHTRPKCVIETGVANGLSTFVIVQAMIANGMGKLYSIDVSHDVGPRLTEEELEHWTLLVLDGKPSKSSLNLTISHLPPFEIFIHDSKHTFWWQKWEYEAALRGLVSGGFLLSDDVDSSWAFHDVVCAKFPKQSTILIDGNKAFGGVRVQDN